jgi:hypothetical protein
MTPLRFAAPTQRRRIVAGCWTLARQLGYSADVPEWGSRIGLNKIKSAHQSDMRERSSSFFDEGMIKIKQRPGKRFLSEMR